MDFCRTCKKCQKSHDKCNLSDVNYEKVKRLNIIKLENNETFKSCENCEKRGIRCELIPRKKRYQKRKQIRVLSVNKHKFIRTPRKRNNMNVANSHERHGCIQKCPNIQRSLYPNSIYPSHRKIFITDIETREVLNFLMDYDWK